MDPVSAVTAAANSAAYLPPAAEVSTTVGGTIISTIAAVSPWVWVGAGAVVLVGGVAIYYYRKEIGAALPKVGNAIINAVGFVGAVFLSPLVVAGALLGLVAASAHEAHDTFYTACRAKAQKVEPKSEPELKAETKPTETPAAPAKEKKQKDVIKVVKGVRVVQDPATRVSDVFPERQEASEKSEEVVEAPSNN